MPNLVATFSKNLWTIKSKAQVTPLAFYSAQYAGAYFIFHVQLIRHVTR